MAILKQCAAARLTLAENSEAFDVALGTLAAALATLPAIILLRLAQGETIESRGWKYSRAS
jgi:hypothetical protein